MKGGLIRVDWNEEWKKMNASGEVENDKSEFWDKFAQKFRKKYKGKDPYIEQFYELAEIQPGDTLFDMGCASGTLAIPFAEKGHEVYAADFAPQMLKVLMRDAEEAGLADRIHPIQLDWNEDWVKRDLPVCDVAFASRSLIFKDLTSSLEKLESVASRRIVVGAWDLPVKGFDRYVSKAIGYERAGHGTHLMILNELLQRDVLPELLFIRSPFRLSKYESYEAGLEILKDSFRNINGLSEEQESLLEDYCREHMRHLTADRNEIEETAVGARNDGRLLTDYWQLDHEDMHTVALIRWNKADI